MHPFSYIKIHVRYFFPYLMSHICKLLDQSIQHERHQVWMYIHVVIILILANVQNDNIGDFKSTWSLAHGHNYIIMTLVKLPLWSCYGESGTLCII